MTDEDIIAELGVQDLDADTQHRIVNDYSMQVGAAVLEGLTDEEIEEYEQIIDGNQEVIDHWLDANVPDFKDAIAYQELAAGFDEDPEKVAADKVFASMAWIEKKNPNLSEKVAAVKDKIKANLDLYK